MEPTYPISREQLHRYTFIRAERERNLFIMEGIKFITTTILDTAAPPGANVYTFRFGIDPVVTYCEILVASVIAACTVKYPNVYVPVRDGPYTLLFEQMMSIVRERFPDCSFTQDPARKYLFVDWS
jgi:hypothetical protein